MTPDFGPGFPGGLYIAQGGVNAPSTQDFKLVAWRDIKRALDLPKIQLAERGARRE